MSSGSSSALRRVLVIDDDPHERQLAATVLASAGGFEPFPVSDALAFAEALARGAFDAVVTEAAVRWAEAPRILDAVKQAGRHHAVVLFTKDERADAVLEAFRHGLDDVVTKSPRGFVELPTVLRKAADRLSERSRETDARFEKLLEKLERATFTCTADGRLLSVNRPFVELLGFAGRDEALRPNAFELLFGADRDERARLLRDERFVKERRTVTLADGRRLTVDVALSLAKLDGGTKVVTGLVEVPIVPKAEVAKADPTGLGERAMVFAHDLKEPLRTMVRSTDALRTRYRGQLDADADEHLGFVADAAKRMQAQVRKVFEKVAPVAEEERTDVADPPRREPERPRVVPPPVATSDVPGADAGESLRIVLANLQATIDASRARVTSGPLPTLAVDPDSLLQLLQNLVGNALKFRRDEPPRIHVSAERRDGEWLLSVADNGIGVAPEHAEKIFEMFERGPEGARFPGSGIGLAVCKRIVERHGGRIWVHGSPGEGATFFCTLPAAKGEARARGRTAG